MSPIHETKKVQGTGSLRNHQKILDGNNYCRGCGGSELIHHPENDTFRCAYCGKGNEFYRHKKSNMKSFQEMLDLESLFEFAHIMARVTLVLTIITGTAWAVWSLVWFEPLQKPLVRIEGSGGAGSVAGHFFETEYVSKGGGGAGGPARPCPPGRKLGLVVTTSATLSLSGLVSYDIPCVDLTPPSR